MNQNDMVLTPGVVDKTSWGAVIKITPFINFEQKIVTTYYNSFTDLIGTLGGFKAAIDPVINNLLAPSFIGMFFLGLCEIIKKFNIKTYCA